MTIATDQTKSQMDVKTEQWMRMYRRMVMIREFEEQVNELYTRALMPGLAHLTLAKKRWLWEFARRFAGTTTLRARTGDMAIAWRRELRPTGCSRSCWAKRRDIAVAKEGPCILRTRRREIWGRTRSSGAARGIATGRHFRRRD